MNKTTNFSKKTRIAASLLTAVLLLALSPIPVLAYSPAQVYEYQDQQFNGGNDFISFASDQADFQNTVDPFLEHGADYDIFVDVSGQSYVQTDTNSQIGRILCSHDWVDGTLYTHEKLDNGGCKLYCYDAQRCSICYSCRNITLVRTINYVKCPH